MKRSKKKTTKLKINILPRLKCFLFVYLKCDLKRSRTIFSSRENPNDARSRRSNIFLKLLKDSAADLILQKSFRRETEQWIFRQGPS